MKKCCFVKQEDKLDCGIASLATILLYYNKKYSLKQLKTIIRYNRHTRTNLFQLYSIAIKLGFKATGLILESIEAFNCIKLPCIGQIEISQDVLHFIVIYKMEQNFITIADPAKGLRIISIENFLNCFTGKILIIY